jgi:hypothetical protein
VARSSRLSHRGTTCRALTCRLRRAWLTDVGRQAPPPRSRTMALFACLPRSSIPASPVIPSSFGTPSNGGEIASLDRRCASPSSRPSSFLGESPRRSCDRLRHWHKASRQPGSDASSGSILIAVWSCLFAALEGDAPFALCEGHQLTRSVSPSFNTSTLCPIMAFVAAGRHHTVKNGWIGV